MIYNLYNAIISHNSICKILQIVIQHFVHKNACHAFTVQSLLFVQDNNEKFTNYYTVEPRLSGPLWSQEISRRLDK